ncbi:MAG: hypothetical protein IH587_09065, partial [Anaerolineae bacterium]|nr:hypothetical protein [Anaerolineae bacterium]
MSDIQFDEVMALALQLSPAEQARLVERLAAAMSDVLTKRASEALTTEHEEPVRQFEQAARMIGEEAEHLGLTD